MQLLAPPRAAVSRRQSSSRRAATTQQTPDTHAPVVAAGLLLVLPAAAPGPALAAKVCFDVPDALADWQGTLLHSPVLALGLAGLGLALFPRLIRVAINYLALPAIVAMLGFAAISYPEQTASSVYTVLEFVKDHPAASSVGIIVAAGALLGPDLLAGVTVAGAMVLLAVQLGFLQAPRLPSLPKLPGQTFLTQQLGRTGQAIKDRLDDLDHDEQNGKSGGDGDGGGRDRGSGRARGAAQLPAGLVGRQGLPADSAGRGSSSSSSSRRAGREAPALLDVGLEAGGGPAALASGGREQPGTPGSGAAAVRGGPDEAVMQSGRQQQEQQWQQQWLGADLMAGPPLLQAEQHEAAAAAAAAAAAQQAAGGPATQHQFLQQQQQQQQQHSGAQHSGFL